MKNAIVLFRRYNDFDHTTPIVNYIAKKNPNLLNILFVHEY